MPNRKAKDRKRRRRDLNETLSVNGRTAKQYKKRKLRKELKNKHRGNIYGI